MSAPQASAPQHRGTGLDSDIHVPDLRGVDDPNVHGNRNYWSRYDWPKGGDEWSDPWGGTRALWFSTILPRLAPYLPADDILEIAPGFGRCTQFLRLACKRLTLVDLVPKCIRACMSRFANDDHITYHVNNGRSLDMLGDHALDLAFSWDSLVHAEHQTVREYLRQLARKLRPGGVVFFHHSNLGQYEGSIPDDPDGTVLGGRRPSMSAQKFRQDCTEFGLRCLSQELIPWTNTDLYIDSISVALRDDSGADARPVVVEHTRWRDEIAMARRLAEHYTKPAADGVC